MCGIFAVFTPHMLEQNVLQKTAALLSHRGPDGAGIRRIRGKNNYIYFLHKRLSILDLSDKGLQPMEDPDSGCIIIYNGELYNYKEIKKILLDSSFSFKTQTDTEIVLNSYLKWGKNCLNYFNAMFSFIIWDPRDQTVFVARDRFGEKPLFFSRMNAAKQMLIASEMKAILEYPQFQPVIDWDILENYLRFGKSVTTDHKTPFKNICQLSPASWMILSVEGALLEEGTYWQPVSEKSTQSKNDKEFIHEFSNLLESSILARADCDVQVGACLSGGLDSTSIVGYLFKNKVANFHSTISVRFDDDPTISEGSYLDIATDYYQGNHFMISPDPLTLLSEMEKIHWHHEVPLPSSSMFLEWSVAKKAKEIGNVVMLDGQGSDELLGGYPYYFQYYQKEMLYRKKYRELLKNTHLFRKYLKQESKKYKDATRRIPMSSSHSLVQLLILYIKQKIKSRALIGKSTKNISLFDSSMYFSHFIKNGLCSTSLQEQLHSADRNGMAFGIETRFPFLDYKLVDFCLQLPLHLLIKGGMQKFILRQAIQNVVPEQIYKRKDKIGFLSPQDIWLRTTLKGWVQEMMVHSSFKHPLFFDTQKAKEDLENFYNNAPSVDSGLIWRYASLSQWMQVFKVN